MPIYVPDTTQEKGKSDARRHRDKQKEAIKEKLPEIIAEETIITGKRGKVVKIPIRSIDIPHFRPKKNEDDGGYGLGQGPGEPGDVIGKGQGEGQGDEGEPGNQPGEEWLETEVDIEELIEMMLEDLGLPKLEEKELRQIIVELGYKISGLTKVGPWVLLDSLKTASEGMKKFWFFLRALEAETKFPELVCFSALKKSKGFMEDALKFIDEYKINPDSLPVETEIQPFPILDNEDLRFREIEKDTQYQSRAVIIAMMDVSGSMTRDKKYLARSMLFWFTAFLRKLYEQVEIRFVIHHTEAKIVDEESFFKTGESGGTYCYTAYEIANNLVATEYPTDQFNVYVIHLSDGEDFDATRTKEEIEKLFAKNINMLGYGEIKPNEQYAYDSDLFKVFKEQFPVQQVIDSEISMLVGAKTFPFFGVKITRKEHLWPALKQLLKKDRWAND